MRYGEIQTDPTFVYTQYDQFSPETNIPIITGGTAVVTINSATGPIVTLSGGTTGLTYTTVGSTISLGGDLIVANGGTGRTTLANHGVIIGAAAGAVNVTGTGSAGEVLTSNGASADPTFQAAGSSALDVITIDDSDSPYILTDANDVILVNTFVAPVTITLHDPTIATQKPYYFKLIRTSGGNDMILDGDGFDIDGASTQQTNVQYVSFTLVPENSASLWWIV